MIRIEEMSMNALPALSTVFYKGWVLRFSEGYARRGNSVSVIYAYAGDLYKNIEHCEALYNAEMLPTVFKITSHEVYRSIDEALESRGYKVVAKTDIMTMDLGKFIPAETAAEFTVHITNNLTEEWYKGCRALHDLNAHHQKVLHKMLSCIIPTTKYASVIIDNQIVAVGVGVSESDHMGIYHVYVHEEFRRRGLGKSIMEALLKEAKALGNTQTYLQVVAENDKAIKLYHQMGYVKVYDYWYRVKQ